MVLFQPENESTYESKLAEIVRDLSQGPSDRHLVRDFQALVVGGDFSYYVGSEEVSNLIAAEEKRVHRLDRYLGFEEAVGELQERGERSLGS